MATDPITLVLIYDENRDNFFPIEEGKKPDPESNTYLIIDENNKKITLSFTPTSSLIEKRTIERRVNSFIKTGYSVPGSQGLRIGAKLPLTKIDPNSGDIPEILLSHGHAFGKGKLVRDSVPDYIEQESNYEVQEGSAGTHSDVTGKPSPEKKKDRPTPSKTATPRPKSKEETKAKPRLEPTPEPMPVSKEDGLLISPDDEHLFILGQFIDMYIQQGFNIHVYKNADGKYEFKTVKHESTFFIDGNQLFQN